MCSTTLTLASTRFWTWSICTRIKRRRDIKDRLVKTFSGGQQARLLLASALIQDPDILLLDEPTNNLDKAGIEHLTQFLIDYKKTCLVISHDADFLNSFTHGVLYLDVHTRKVEQYVGDYKDVVEQISARIEKENMANARRAKEILANKEQANAFAMKGGQMRLVAKRMREKAEELEDEMVDVRTGGQDDKAVPYSRADGCHRRHHINIFVWNDKPENSQAGEEDVRHSLAPQDASNYFRAKWSGEEYIVGIDCEGAQGGCASEGIFGEREG